MVYVIDWLNNIDRESCFYDSALLSTIIPKNESASKYSVYEYPKDINKLVSLLNEGQIKLSYVELDNIEEGFKPPDEYTEKYLEAYPPRGFFSMMFDEKVWLRYQAWKWLKQQGETNVEFRRGQRCITAHDLKLEIKTEFVQPGEIIKHLEKGVNGFYYVPDTTILFQFSSTPLMKTELQKKRNNEKERKKTFLKSDSPNSIFPFAEEFSYENPSNDVRKGDIVRWKHDKSGFAKGIVSRIIEPFQNAQEVYENYLLDTRMVFYPKDLDFLTADKIDSKERALVSYSDSPKKRQLNYITPKTDELMVVASLSFMLEYAEWYVKQCGIQISVKMTNDRKEDFNAAYYSPDHSILIHEINMWNTIIHYYLHYDRKPEYTMALIISHELGHAHPIASKPLGPEFGSLVDEINHLLRILRETKGNFFEQSLSELNVFRGNWEELDRNLKTFHYIELNAELDAWKYGREYVPNFLLDEFNRDNLAGYERYIKSQYKMKYEVANLGAEITNALFLKGASLVKNNK